MKAACFMIPALLAFSLAAFGAERTARKKEPPKAAAAGVRSFQRVINAGSPGDGASLKDWSEPMDEAALFNWAKSAGLSLIPDRGPVADGRARFVRRFGSRAVVDGLDRNRVYHLWIDIVSYRALKPAEILTRLEIYIDGRKVKTLSPAYLTEEHPPLGIEVPYDLSQDGRIEVLFKEYSLNAGYWGIWDIIVTETPGMPERVEAAAPVEEKGKMVPAERIIGPGPAEKKAKGKIEKADGREGAGTVKKPAVKKAGVKKPGTDDAKPGAARKPGKVKKAPAGKGAGEKTAPLEKKDEKSGKGAVPERRADDGNQVREPATGPGQPRLPSEPVAPTVELKEKNQGPEKNDAGDNRRKTDGVLDKIIPRG